MIGSDNVRSHSDLTNATIELYDKSVGPLNNDWQYWIAKWWSWLLSIPKSVSPSNDCTGEFYSINQHADSPVYFLGGGVTGLASPDWRLGRDKVIRKISVPKGKSLLVLPAGELMSTTDISIVFSG